MDPDSLAELLRQLNGYRRVGGPREVPESVLAEARDTIIALLAETARLREDVRAAKREDPDSEDWGTYRHVRDTLYPTGPVCDACGAETGERAGKCPVCGRAWVDRRATRARTASSG